MIAMYNRYIPQSDGSYRRNRVQDSPPPSPHRPAPPPPERHFEEPPQHNQSPPVSSQGGSIGSFLRQLLPKGLDTGDLLIIILLLLMAGDCAEEQNTAMLTLALYLFL